MSNIWRRRNSTPTADEADANSVIYGFTPVRRTNHYMPSLKEGSIVKVDHFEVARMFDNCQVIANTNLETGKHSIFGSLKQDYNQANSSGMTYQQLKLLFPKDCIDYGFWEEKDLAPEKKTVTTLLTNFSVPSRTADGS
ncbi:hypothetical protein F2Q70_00024780 [Brassica cretica]|uniref:Uncharacterized protein n=1 Tax=Brassica cretica TaxID=69181 RepID=A0A8S9L4X1_BRACR|nr:hypothetical protein F2Q70_00024780 [Brassica cretica]